MTNKELQLKCNEDKWNASVAYGADRSGKMDFCLGCPYCNDQYICALIDNEEERTTGVACAKNVRRLQKRKK